jgi:PAS domain S-box-containing protein
MTLFIIPLIFIGVLFIWLGQLPVIGSRLAACNYRLRHQWRRRLPLWSVSLMDHLDDGLIILDKAWCVVEVNEKAERLMGKSAVSVIGQRLTTIWPELRGELTATNPEQVVISQDKLGLPGSYELRFVSSYNKQNKGYVLCIRDVTAEQNLAEMRRDMTQTMVHDLRAPLSNSLFGLQMLQSHLHGQATAETNKIIEMMISNTEKTLERVNKILDTERLESQKMPLAFSAVVLADVIDNVLDAQGSRITDKELRIVRRLPQTLAPVWADFDLLERVLQNLLDNSIKFTAVGGKIVIAATTEDNTVYISVSDTGTGIPQQMHGYIFDKFTGESDKGGSGLGLAFCKMVLAAHGQDIWVDSETGQGTTFTFSLSLVPQPDHIPQQIAA